MQNLRAERGEGSDGKEKGMNLKRIELISYPTRGAQQSTYPVRNFDCRPTTDYSYSMHDELAS